MRTKFSRGTFSYLIKYSRLKCPKTPVFPSSVAHSRFNLFGVFVFCLQHFVYLQYASFICNARFYLQRTFFICNALFLFAAYFFYLQRFLFVCSVLIYLQCTFFICSVPFLFAAFLFYLQRTFFYLQRSFFVCNVSFLFAAFLFCLQHFFFVCSVSLVGHRTKGDSLVITWQECNHTLKSVQKT